MRSNRTLDPVVDYHEVLEDTGTRSQYKELIQHRPTLVDGGHHCARCDTWYPCITVQDLLKEMSTQ